MNRLLTVFVSAATLIVTTYLRPGLAGVDVDINIGVPPPPAVVFPGPPRVVVIPRTQVYYVPGATDYDMYRFGPYWYVDRDGYWYRSRAYGGPFKFVEYRRVPRAIVVVPAGFRHHPLRPLHPHGERRFEHRGRGHHRH
jgi:hypothetical protein